MTFKTMQCMIIAVLFAMSFAINAQTSKDETAIRAIFKVQSEAWNKGDIQAIMETYWKSDDLLFIGKKGPIYGWANTLERYLKTYPNRQAMGHLEFDIMNVKSRSEDVNSVVGKYHLTREGMDDLEGHFLILVERMNDQWLIVADSTH